MVYITLLILFYEHLIIFCIIFPRLVFRMLVTVYPLCFRKFLFWVISNSLSIFNCTDCPIVTCRDPRQSKTGLATGRIQKLQFISLNIIEPLFDVTLPHIIVLLVLLSIVVSTGRLSRSMFWICYDTIELSFERKLPWSFINLVRLCCLIGYSVRLTREVLLSNRTFILLWKFGDEMALVRKILLSGLNCTGR